MFIGGYFLRFLGTVVLYIYEALLALIQGKKILSFKEVWSTPYSTDFFSSVSAELLQKMVGFGFIIFIAIIMHFFPSLFWWW